MNEEYKEGTFIFGECSVIVAIEDERWHISIAHPTRLPTYEELKEARYKFVPDEYYMAQIFPPQDEFVNAHPFCLHLWQVGQKVEKVPFVAFGNDELKDLPEIGVETNCPNCGLRHVVEYGKDKDNNENKTIGFVKCGNSSYLVAVNGKEIPLPKKKDDQRN